MIRHMVLFSAKNPRDIPTIRDALAQMATIPGPSLFEVATNDKRDPLSNEIDVVLYAEFPDYASLESYQAHPNYQSAVAVVRPLRETRVVADYEVST